MAYDMPYVHRKGTAVKRYQYLDIARGIGLLLVIISHSCGLSSYLINYYIPLFFVVSGYIYKEGRSYRENIGKKASRLLLPYFGYSAALLAFYALLGRTFSETLRSAGGVLYSRYCLYDTSRSVDNVYLFTVANGAMWYLTAFFVTSLLYHALVDRCLKSRKFFIVSLAVLTAVTMLLADIPVLLPWSLDLACVGTIFMLAGTCLGRAAYFEKKTSPLSFLLVLAAYLLLSFCNPGINMSVREYGKYQAFSVPLFILVGISGSMVCIWIGKLIQDNFVGTFIGYIGKNTIVLLAFHILGLEIFAMIAGKVIDVSSLSGVTFILYHTVRISASVCGCLALGFLLDRVKGVWQRKRKKWKADET